MLTGGPVQMLICENNNYEKFERYGTCRQLRCNCDVPLGLVTDGRMDELAEGI